MYIVEGSLFRNLVTDLNLEILNSLFFAWISSIIWQLFWCHSQDESNIFNLYFIIATLRTTSQAAVKKETTLIEFFAMQAMFFKKVYTSLLTRYQHCPICKNLNILANCGQNCMKIGFLESSWQTWSDWLKRSLKKTCLRNSWPRTMLANLSKFN